MERQTLAATEVKTVNHEARIRQPLDTHQGEKSSIAQIVKTQAAQDTQKLIELREQNVDLLGTPILSNREERKAASTLEYRYQIPQAAIEKYKEMSSSDIRQGIGKGTITDDMDAIRIMYLKHLEESQEQVVRMSTQHPDLREGEIERHKLITKQYTPLIYGSPAGIAKALSEEAQLAESTRYPLEDDYGHPSETNKRLMAEDRIAAIHLREMQKRFEQQAQAEGIPLEKLRQEQEHNQLTAEQLRTLGYLRNHPDQLDAIGRLRGMNYEDMQPLVDSLQEMEVQETGSTPTNLLIEILLTFIDAIKETTVETVKKTVEAV